MKPVSRGSTSIVHAPPLTLPNKGYNCNVSPSCLREGTRTRLQEDPSPAGECPYSKTAGGLMPQARTNAPWHVHRPDDTSQKKMATCLPHNGCTDYAPTVWASSPLHKSVQIDTRAVRKCQIKMSREEVFGLRGTRGREAAWWSETGREGATTQKCQPNIQKTTRAVTCEQACGQLVG